MTETQDPTNLYQKSNNNLIRYCGFCEKQLIIPNRSIVHNAIYLKIYGLPKLHKPNIPLRRIVFTIQTHVSS